MAEPITYELHREPLPGLAELGAQVELREVNYGAVKRAMASASEGLVGEALLGASLYVDGEPLGLDGVLELPGRYSSAIAEALARTLEVHGLHRGTRGEAREDEDEDATDAGDRPGEA